jgi:hypothetical protein
VEEIILVSTTVATSTEQTTRTSRASEDSQTTAQEETQPIETSSIASTTIAAETTSIQEITTLSTTQVADSTSTSTSTTETPTTIEISTTTPAPFEFTNSLPYVLAPMAADPETIAAQVDSDFANAMLGIPSSFSAPLVVESADGIQYINRNYLNYLTRILFEKNRYPLKIRGKNSVILH